MIRAVGQGKDGPVIFLGIVEANVRRMKAGDPMFLDLGALIKEAAKGAPGGRTTLGLAINYAPTHADVLAVWEEHGIPVDDDMRKAAAEVDVEIENEGSHDGT